MFAVALGAMMVAVAASLAKWGSSASGRGDEQNQLSQRARLLRSQIRADIEAAGIGSTGAVAVPNSAFWNSYNVMTVANRRAMPVVRGDNNITVAGLVAANTDVIQLVVADPTPESRRVTDDVSGPPGATASLLYFDPPLDCVSPIIYIVDHSAPNGAGRSHLARVAAANPDGVTLAEPLEFAIPAGADVMCARITTYWVDPNFQLMRNDAVPGAPVTPIGSLFISGPNEVITPGAIDFQVAYSLSSEALARNTAPSARWAFGAGSPTAAAGRDWFEVRIVRLNLMLRSLRKVQDTNFLIGISLLEDEPVEKTVEQTYGRQLLQTSVVLTNQKFFDYSAPAGQEAEPY
jgi:hypothetical protein